MPPSIGTDRTSGAATRTRRPGSATVRNRAGRVAAVAATMVLLSSVAAAAAAHFRAGATYTGQGVKCVGTPVPGATCTFTFRASATGATLALAGHKSVVSVWSCPGGGGEALLGGTHAGADPVPVIRLHPGGSVYGTAGQGAKQVSVSGGLTGGAGAVTVRFHLVRSKCVGPRIVLRAR